MPDSLICVDLTRTPEQQQTRPHNRWHPEIPPVISVEPGSVFRVECMDLTGGRVLNNDSADDIKRLNLSELHYLSGPIAVRGAKPGDLLCVELLETGPIAGAEWGFTGILDGKHGIGLLSDEFGQARKAIWDLDGVFASSRHIGGVRFAGLPHPSIVGCAPSQELMERWMSRETRVMRAHSGPGAVALPTEEGAMLGHLGEARASAVAATAARTWAARESGGNIDVKEFTRGARGYFPVHVEGANLSVGDIHFSQGDGKIGGFGAIKMAGWLDLRVEVIENGVERLGIRNVVIESSPVVARNDNYLIFQGVSVAESGEQHYLDVRMAYRRACERAIDYLERAGYAREQAYVLLSAAPVDGRMSCLVEYPNVCVTLALPTSIFEADLSLAAKTASVDFGSLARCSALPPEPPA